MNAAVCTFALFLIACLNAGCGPTDTDENPATMQRTEVSHAPPSKLANRAYADVNGLRMYYEIHGAGPTLLLLHGGAGAIPEKWVGFLAGQFQVVAMEQMGHGRTRDIPDRAFHYHGMAEDTIELMRQLGIERAMVVGYSDGGIIGLDMAIHHPERVTKLAVTGANYRTEGYRPEILKEAISATPDDWPASEEYRRLSPDGADHWPIVLRRLQQMWAVEPSYTREQLQRVKAPALIIVGDRDIVTAEHAVEMFQSISGAQLCIVPNAGHGVMPQETLLAFLGASPSGAK